MALGGTPIAAPISLLTGDASKTYETLSILRGFQITISSVTLTKWPCLRSAIAALRPPSPAPTMAIFSGLASAVGSDIMRRRPISAREDYEAPLGVFKIYL